MLSGLSVRNVVLIERLDLAFARGLTALTGETGAGKSILLDALQRRRNGHAPASAAAQYTANGIGGRGPNARHRTSRLRARRDGQLGRRWRCAQL